ncbi:MAG: NAD-glutamate dehydrogenase [Epsilonproteobacteria bacterium]|nr:NAD-glutamate dehydrogenase [Campylobacterota bacterium]
MVKFENSTFIIQSDLPISTIIKIFENFKIEITDIQKQNNTLYLKTTIDTIHPEIIKIIKGILSKSYPLYCKLYFLANFGLSIREISLIRAIVKYQKQLLYEFEEIKIINELNKFPKIAKLIVEYFKEKFSKQNLSKESVIEEELKKVIHPESHKILEFFYIIVKNMVRTNYFLQRETISFKIYTQNFKNILFGIQPNIEMFVYHHEFNGIHLRMSKVSRGGIRHSNRSDFREEIKDLVTTQAIKNAFIIPDGGKGGFITTITPKEAYQMFINALLDLIDVGDVDVIKYDGEDFYFVVAADKGTAHFSDIANEIAIKRGYFLKDAFASGGSTGYSHKELGITAKGAIKSASRHFLEIGKDIYKDKISVVGVGSMRGDVFGNGMLLNKNFLLIGAISHKYIFVDPNPDPKTAYKERKRLFKEEKGWEEYDKSKISQGGGVFKRDERVKLSPELKKLFNTKKVYLTGEEIAKELLKLKVDMLYFGGIGTYIKASDELNIHISDKENENIRINANEIKAFCVCEGANLALTTKARYEYALNSGKINLDAIDNSAGVNISDYEVNIKIHLNSLVEKGEITEEKKIKILKDLTDEVVERVLKNNYDHSLIITLDSKRVYKEKLIKVIEVLETTDFFKRHYYALPKNSEIDTIYKNSELIRPVSALIMLNVKNFLKKYILKIEDDYFNAYFNEYFPKSLNIEEHPLKKEIISAVITNKIVNSLGIGFIADFNKNFKNKIVSFLIIDELLEASRLYEEIKALDFKISPQKQYELYFDIHETIKFAIRWLVKAIENSNINPFVFLVYKNELKEIIPQIDINNFKKLKTYFKFLPAILHLRHQNYDLKTIFKLFEVIINKFKINKLLKEIHNFKPKNKLEKDLKEEVEEMIEYFVIQLATEILFSKNFNEKEVRKSFNSFIKSKEDKYQQIIKEINQAKTLNEFIHISNSLILQLLK